MFNFDENIYDKLRRYCSYQERAISEVRDKMRQLGVVESMYDEYINLLQEEGYQNEVRYAESYASGKMRMKGWGARKVALHLKHKGVTTTIIDKAIAAHQGDAYIDRLRLLAQSKLDNLKGKDDYERKSKVYKYLQQKGYASDHIHSVLFNSDEPLV